jgi:O-antigen ligase
VTEADVSRSSILSAALVLAVLILLPVGRTSELPLLIAAIGGLVWFLRERREFACEPDVRLVLVLFACYWLPILISALDAEKSAKAWSSAAEVLRFLPFAIFTVVALRRPGIWSRFELAVAALVSLWLIDAWIQFLTGHSLGGAPERERLAGIFGADNLKLGPVLAVLAPFFLLGMRRIAGRPGLLAGFVLILVPILLSGSRAAWLSMSLVAVAFAWRETRSLRRFAPLLLGAGLAMLVAIILLWRGSTALEARMERSLLAFQGSTQAIDEASAGRLTIWRIALDMSAEHPLNGVGVRGFRYAYPQYAEAEDRFIVVEGESRQGAAHAHQIVLEVLSETGLIGLIAWLFGAFVAARSWWRADAVARDRAWAPALALAVMCFPLNTHFAFYSAWWGLFFWWVIAVFVGALALPAQQTQRDRSDHAGTANQHAP